MISRETIEHVALIKKNFSMFPVLLILGLFHVMGEVSLLWAASGEAKKTLSRKSYRTDKKPLHDCTRINGRYGYYANPWCTPREQAHWDRFVSQKALKK